MKRNFGWMLAAMVLVVWGSSQGCRKLASPTFPPANTPTATFTSLITNTPTNTRTITPTFTVTSSPTNTPSPTITWTPTITPTFTQTNTPGGPTDTPTFTFTSTGTSTFTGTPTPTSTFTFTPSPTATLAGCPYPPASPYTFDSSIGCWNTLNDLTTTTVNWSSAPPAGSASGGGAFHAHVAYSATAQVKEEFELPLPANTDLTGQVYTIHLYVSSAVQGTAWGGGIQPYIKTGAGLVFCSKAWTNITGFGAWYTYNMDLSATCTGGVVSDVRAIGFQVIIATGGGTGDIYLDDVALTAPYTPTPTPCTMLLNGFETLSDNGTTAAGNAADTLASVTSATAPTGSITEGSHNLQITMASNPGWNELWYDNGITFNNVWSAYHQIQMDVYVSSAVMAGASWNQVILQADAGTKTNQLFTTEPYLGIVAGQQTLTWNIDFTKGTILASDTITGLHFIINSDIKPGTIYIDNVHLNKTSCP